MEKESLEVRFDPVAVHDLPGWKNDDLATFYPAFKRSCESLATLSPDAPFFKNNFTPIPFSNGDWLAVCQNLPGSRMVDPSKEEVILPSPQELRAFFENHFQAYLVKTRTISLSPAELSAKSAAEKEPLAEEDWNSTGLFTGYYEPILKGAWHKSDQYTAPLYRKPADLTIIEDLNVGNGKRIIGRYLQDEFIPYFTRAEIIAGALEQQALEMIWVENSIDAFFLQIQGSGIVELEGGTQLRVGYDGTNGHKYVAIGKTLIERGELTRSEVTMESIRQWLFGHPTQAEEVMSTNPSFVFFRLLTSSGPIGMQGLPLTPLRSLAVDHSLLPMGLPIWLDTDHPGGGQLQRLFISQDTGGAIRGAIRGDVFWGNGVSAGNHAGKMKSKGKYFLLVPRKLTK